EDGIRDRNVTGVQTCALPIFKRAGFRILEVPTEWTDKIGSKVRLFRTSLVMFLSAFRIRLIYSPIYPWLRPLRPLEGWVYRKLQIGRASCRERVYIAVVAVFF